MCLLLAGLGGMSMIQSPPLPAQLIECSDVAIGVHCLMAGLRLQRG
jgi:hypothetical protein